jgi:hypothetical protein
VNGYDGGLACCGRTIVVGTRDGLVCLMPQQPNEAIRHPLHLSQKLHVFSGDLLVKSGCSKDN